MIGRGQKQCVVGQVTGLLFCIQVTKTLSEFHFHFFRLLKQYEAVCHALHETDIELAGINVIKELGLSVDGNVGRYSRRPPKTANPQNKHSGA